MNAQLTVMNIMVLNDVSGNTYQPVSTHINPPADAHTASPVGDKSPKDAVDDPVVGDAEMTKVVRDKGELLPQQTKKDGAGEEPSMVVRIHR